MPQMQGHGVRGSRQRFLAEMAQEQAEREGLEPVGKSYVPGVGYRPITRAAIFSDRRVPHPLIAPRVKEGLRAHGGPGLHQPPSNRSAAGQRLRFNDRPEAGKNEYRMSYDRKPRGLRERVTQRARQFVDDVQSGGHHSAQAEPRGAGRGGTFHLTRHAMSSRQNAERLAVHEFGHMTPRRNTQNMVSRMERDPRVYGREEGRADYLSGSSDYANLGDGFQTGYREVQERMANAGTRRYPRKQTRLARNAVRNIPDNQFGKREPLKTHVTEQDAHRLVREHGMTGPLPGHLTREQRMAAYEARYVASGGRKGEKWQRRAVAADKVKNIGLGGATAAGAALLASRTKTGARAGEAIGRAAGHLPGVRRLNRTTVGHHAENAGIASAVAGGAGELYAGHARRRRASYASAPAGVAASALRRMQDYTPEHR